jgi:hypothetical protein
MKTWLKRIRGAVGMALTFAVAGAVIGAIIALGFVVRTGSRPDALFPLMLGALGFVTGLLFSGVLMLMEGRRRFDQMSVPRFAAWGGAAGLGLSATFFLAVSRGDFSFFKYFFVVGPIASVAAAGCAAGSLALAKRAQDRDLLKAAEEVPALGEAEGP